MSINIIVEDKSLSPKNCKVLRKNFSVVYDKLLLIYPKRLYIVTI